MHRKVCDFVTYSKKVYLSDTKECDIVVTHSFVCDVTGAHLCIYVTLWNAL